MQEGDDLVHTNTLFPGESVGDLDVLDGALHAVPAIAVSTVPDLQRWSLPSCLALVGPAMLMTRLDAPAASPCSTIPSCSAECTCEH